MRRRNGAVMRHDMVFCKADMVFRKAFATCQVASLDGRITLLSQGSKAFYAHDPLTGEEFWRVEDRTGHSAATRPVTANACSVVFDRSRLATA